MEEVTFAPRLSRILEKNKKEIAQAVREISESRSRLMELLGVGEFNSLESLEVDENYRKSGLQLQYLIDLFDAYVDGGQDSGERRKRMHQFADNYQKHPDEIKRELEYVGLEF